MKNLLRHLKIIVAALLSAACVALSGEGGLLAADLSDAGMSAGGDAPAGADIPADAADADTLAVFGPSSLDSSGLLPIPLAAELTVPAGGPAQVRADYGVNYIGPAISVFIPGGGQTYQGRYLMGAGFLVAGAASAGFSVYWWDEAASRRGEAGRLRDSAAVMGRSGAAGDSVLALWYSAAAGQADFEARQARFTAYSALAWAGGIYLFNFLDALEAGGVTSNGEYRSPAVAGFLAAVPFLGLGQFYNGRPRKAGMMAMTQTSLMVTAYGHHRLMGMASGEYNRMMDPESAQHAYGAEQLNYWKARYDRSFSRRNTYLWVSLFAYIYSIFDAVVDAHLSDYENRVRVGPDLAVGPYGTGLMLTLTHKF